MIALLDVQLASNWAKLVSTEAKLVSNLAMLMSNWEELCVGTPSATTESRVESDDSTVCPAPATSSTARSYAAVVAGKSATHGSCSLVRSQRSEVNFRRSC